MSEYHQFIEEKEKVDFYFNEGYEVYSIIENLSGMLVEFSTTKFAGEKRIQVLLTTAEARKYIATRLLHS